MFSEVPEMMTKKEKNGSDMAKQAMLCNGVVFYPPCLAPYYVCVVY
jgi:hypothetical protein